jgi:hypothetical protein
MELSFGISAFAGQKNFAALPVGNQREPIHYQKRRAKSIEIAVELLPSNR